MGASEVEAFLTGKLQHPTKIRLSVPSRSFTGKYYICNKKTGIQFVDAKRPKRLPVVLTTSEVQIIFVRLPSRIKLWEWAARIMKQRDGERRIWISNNG